jgi:hypothetical protein
LAKHGPISNNNTPNIGWKVVASATIEDFTSVYSH